MIERSILIFHFAVNGFGEKIGRPMLWLSLITFLAVIMVQPNDDFIATKATPLFLLEENKTITKKSVKFLYNVELNASLRFLGTRHQQFYTIVVPKLKAKDEVTDYHNEINNRILFIMSRYVNLITPVNKVWFTPFSEKAQYIATLVSILSWFFIGAFVLALRNRIRRK